MDDIMNRLKGVLNWSLRRQEISRSSETPQESDPERVKWLREVLHSISNRPSETDLLKGALSVLELHSSKESLNQEELDIVKQSFDDVGYFVEDLDHASDLIPLNGIAAISTYLSRNESELVGLACTIITNASQNHIPCQAEFTRSSLPQLISLLSRTDATLQRKALSSISSLVRGYGPARQVFLDSNGPSLLLSCLHSAEGSDRLNVKVFFFLQHLYTEPHATLESIVDDLVDAIAKTISLTKDDIDLLEQSLLTLHQLLQTYSERTRSLLKERAISIDDQTLKLVNDSVSEETQEKLKEINFN